MKRPFTVIGFSMLIISLLVTNISFKLTVALLIGATVIFCIFLIFKKLRKYKIIIFSSFAIVVYIVSFIFTQNIYYNTTLEFENKTEIKGVICQTPQETDYAYTYVIKLDNKNYKIRYVSEENKMFREGDVVSGFVVQNDDYYRDEFFENSLSSKIYFTFFEGDETFIDKIGETNGFYKNIGTVKNWFSDIVDEYIPGESGAIAKAMTIGDKFEITSRTIDSFNYSGTAHLLVISGLHLTLWSISLMRFAEKFSRARKYTAPLGLLCLFFYSALTGFSVSVIRAGAMLGAVLLGKALNRDADSINSIGLALTFILTLNPYATLSTALWFTTLSTLGILMLAQKLILKINEWCKNKRFLQNGVLSTLISTTVISVATTIFTLPVFVVKFELVPIASFISNIVMIDLALVLMVFTIIGALVHSIGFSFVADGIFTIAGAISNFLKIFTEKIGLAEWSTVSVSHKYFEYFLVFALVCITVSCIVKKYRKVLLKSFTVILSILFILLATYCTSYDYHTPSVDVLFTDTTPLVVVNSRGTSVLINPPSTKYEIDIKEILNSHNEKSVDSILVTENTEITPSHLINLYSKINVENTLFCYDSPRIFESRSKSNISNINIGGNITINAENYTEFIEIMCRGKRFVLIDSENAENLFENIKDYDIIILYSANALEVKERIEFENPDTKVFVLKDLQRISFYFD